MVVEILIISTIIGNLAFETYLRIRQLKKVKTSERKILTEEEFTKARSYAIDRLWFALITSFIDSLIDISLFYFRIIERALNLKGNSIMGQTIIYICYTIAFGIIAIPKSIVSQFYLEEKHGFNTCTLKTFVLDLVKSCGVGIVISTLLMPPVLYFMQNYLFFIFYVFVFLVVFQLVMVFLYPDFIQPLFNKFSEMEDSPLKKKINEMATKLNFNLKSIYIMDGSSRSNHSNAYFIGMFSEKRVVLYDTLVKDTDDEIILAILAHEFGHNFLRHIPKNFVFAFFVQFLCLAMLNFSIMHLHGSSIYKIIYFLQLNNVMTVPLKFITNYYSRKHETEADLYAAVMGYGTDLGRGLVKLHRDNKSVVDPDYLFSMYYYSHPSLCERLQSIEEFINKDK